MRAAALVLLLQLAACGREGALDRLATGEQGRVAEVVSGHYLVLDSGLGVRLAGVAAPKDDEAHGAESLAELKRLVDGREVQLFYGGRKRDDYDRAIAQVRLRKGGVWVQKAMLKAGAVRVKTWDDNRALAAEMLEAEAGARNSRRGLWAIDDYKVLLPAEADRAYGFQIVEGRVRRVEARQELGFDAGFVAAVNDRAMKDFAAAGMPPEKLRGRLVRVRGLVRSGPEMRLDHPEQVEVLDEPR
jgi:endonuclease YncB( thermonuclease family)